MFLRPRHGAVRHDRPPCAGAGAGRLHGEDSPGRHRPTTPPAEGFTGQRFHPPAAPAPPPMPDSDRPDIPTRSHSVSGGAAYLDQPSGRSGATSLDHGPGGQRFLESRRLFATTSGRNASLRQDAAVAVHGVATLAQDRFPAWPDHPTQVFSCPPPPAVRGGRGSTGAGSPSRPAPRRRLAGGSRAACRVAGCRVAACVGVMVGGLLLRLGGDARVVAPGVCARSLEYGVTARFANRRASPYRTGAESAGPAVFGECPRSAMSEVPVPVLVTGATGRQGGATARAPLAAGGPVRALVRHAATDRARAVAAYGAELVTGGLHNRESVIRAADGVRPVFSGWILGAEARFHRRDPRYPRHRRGDVPGRHPRRGREGSRSTAVRAHLFLRCGPAHGNSRPDGPPGTREAGRGRRGRDTAIQGRAPRSGLRTGV
ncbi:NmrA family NAD(P)-binding protein [Streptomyces hygroscopicus]|uniref:NmrA family NAD(P)-binding protein n=1 Tax=Streptomyces hygroscopicus TaxID=1912 RepID=UPI003F4D2190